jgi:uncharacterized protein YcgI (DUF1989 family)
MVLSLAPGHGFDERTTVYEMDFLSPACDPAIDFVISSEGKANKSIKLPNLILPE